MKRSFLCFALAFLLSATGCDSSNEPGPDFGRDELKATDCTLCFVEQVNGACNFELMIGTARWSDGRVTAPGELIRLGLYAGVAGEDRTAFPLGTYTLDAQSLCTAGTFSAAESYRAVYEMRGEELISSRGSFRSGTATFAESDGGVSVELNLVLDNGRTLHVTWKGALEVSRRLALDVEAAFCEFRYWRDYYGTGNDNFTVYIGTAEHEGLVILGPGEFLMLSIQAPAVADYRDAKIVPGTYRFDRGDTYADMTISGSECMRILYEPDADGDGRMEETYFYFRDGTLSVTETAAGTYDIELLLESDSGDRIRYAYSGRIDMINNYADLAPDMIEGDKDFVCGFGEVRYQGDGTYQFDLMSGNNPYEFGGWFNRDRMNIYLHLENAGGEASLPGTYTVGQQIDRGGFEIVENMCEVFGSHYFYLDEMTFESVYGFFESGTVEIARDGENYSIRIDVLDSNGHAVRSSFDGVLRYQDLSESGAGLAACATGMPRRVLRR